MTTLTRRSLLGGIGAVLAAPYIVRAASLMPVKPYAFESWWVPLGPYPAPLCRDLLVEMQVIAKLMCEQSGIQPVLMGGNF